MADSEDDESLAGLTQNTFLKAPLESCFDLFSGLLEGDCNVGGESVLILIKVCYATDILNILCLEFKLLNFCSFSVVHVKPSWPQYVGQYGETFV